MSDWLIWDLNWSETCFFFDLIINSNWITCLIIFKGYSLEWIKMTEPWQQQTLLIEHDQNWNQQTLWNRQTLTLPPGSSKPLCLMFFSCRGAKQCWAGVPASASLWARAGGPVQAICTCIFFGVKLMFVSVMNFGQVQKICFVVVKNFWSNSNQFLVIFIWSSELASFIITQL